MTDTVISSATKEVVIGFDQPFCVIGERINPTGRKKLAAEMIVGNFETVKKDALEQVAAGATMTARTTDQTPQLAAPGVELADSSSAANRLLYRVPPASLDKTVLTKERVKPPPNEQPKTE